MKSQLITMLIQMVLTTLSPDLLKKFADMALDFVEDKVLGSASEIDDKLVLPLCTQIRTAFNIPDDD